MNMRSLFFTLHRGVQKYRIRELTKASVATAFGLSLFAQVAMAADPGTSSGKDSPDPKTWAGIGWGLGIAADFDIGGKRVADAQIVNGLVRIKDSSSNVGVSFVLEAHYFFTESRPWPKCYGFGCNNVAFGPFVAIEIGGGTSATTNAGPITGYALGMMVGLQHPDAPSKTSSWNFGVGLRVDPQAKVLGDGFVANQPPPAGETAIRTKTEPRYGLMLLSSFSF
jgi:hypothetical protein